MYVGQHPIASADAGNMVNPTFARQELAGGGNSTLVDTLAQRGRMFRLVLKDIGAQSLVLYAKSTRTLIEGMKQVPNNDKLTCAAGNIAVYLGKYDAEKEVFSHYAKVIGKYVKHGSKDVDFGDFASRMERQRLTRRAAYVVISTPDALPGANSIALNGDSVTFTALAGLLRTMRHERDMDILEETGLFN